MNRMSDKNTNLNNTIIKTNKIKNTNYNNKFLFIKHF